MAKETKKKARAVSKFKAKPKPKTTNKCGHSTKSKGRPKIELCEEQIENLAALGTPVKEIAKFFGVAESTLFKNFSEPLKAGAQNTRNELRQNQLFVANDQLDSKMLIWLGKQLLGQRDKIESEVTHVGEISMLTQD